MLLTSLVDMVVVVHGSHDLVAEPDMRVFLDQQRIAEQIEIIGRIDFPFDQSGHGVALIGDTEGSIEAGDFQAIERELTSAGDLGNNVKIVFPDGFRKFMNYAGEETRRAGIDVLYGVEAKSVDVGKRDPEFVNLAEVL